MFRSIMCGGEHTLIVIILSSWHLLRILRGLVVNIMFVGFVVGEVVWRRSEMKDIWKY